MPRYDVVVVGLGAYGSAAAYQLAKRGAKVLGIDRFSPPHPLGSTHGETRITRMAVGEGAEYSPLALRSRLLWRQIEKENAKLPGHAGDEELFNQCGCLTIFGRETKVVHHGVKDFFRNIAKAAKTHKVKHTTFDSGAALRAAYPQFAVSDDDRGFLDLWGGYLRPEAVVETQLRLAEQRHRASLRRGVTIASIRSSKTGVILTAEDGEMFEADRVLITAGPWLPRFLPAPLRRHFVVTRQALHWFEIKSHADRFAPENCPVFIWDVTGRKLPGMRRAPKAVVYGFPLAGGVGGGLKVTHEEVGPRTDPDRVNRIVTAEEIDHTYRTYVQSFLPDLGPRCIRSATCLYTSVAGGRFVIDNHPEQPRVMFASACSGHGFKHSAAVGEALAERLAGARPSHVSLAPFTLKRLEAFLEKQ
jgi:sarcosine oxidase